MWPMSRVLSILCCEHDEISFFMVADSFIIGEVLIQKIPTVSARSTREVLAGWDPVPGAENTGKMNMRVYSSSSRIGTAVISISLRGLRAPP